MRPRATGSVPVGSDLAREVRVRNSSSSRGVGRVAIEEKRAVEKMKRGSWVMAGRTIVNVGLHEWVLNNSFRFLSIWEELRSVHQLFLSLTVYDFSFSLDTYGKEYMAKRKKFFDLQLTVTSEDVLL